MRSAPWFTIDNIEQIDSPALVVYPDRIQTNIDRMIQMAGSADKLRPHVKTYKMEEVVRLQMKKGIFKFKCATIAEAEMLGNAGAKEVLLAYQPVGPKIERLLKLVNQFPQTTFAALVDNHNTARAIGKTFDQAGKTLAVFLDLDVGMHRTGIPADDHAFALYMFCEQTKGIQPAGLHMYDGHIGDKDLEKRKSKCHEAFQAVEKLAARIAEHQGRQPIMVAGGSPTFPIHAQRLEVECSPGTCMLWDWGYGQKLPEQNFLFGALVVSRVISKLEKNLICTDLRYKSIAAENPLPRVHFLNLPEAKQVLQNEEHLVLEVEDNRHIEIGEVLYGLPLHICPTVALYEKAYVVEEHKINEEWKVLARD